MADIDKALPNEVRKEFELPSEEEIKELALEEVEQEEGSPGPVDIQENEDGSVDIDLDPQAASLKVVTSITQTSQNFYLMMC
jgi:hypothetical protein